MTNNHIHLPFVLGEARIHESSRIDAEFLGPTESMSKLLGQPLAQASTYNEEMKTLMRYTINFLLV